MKTITVYPADTEPKLLKNMNGTFSYSESARIELNFSCKVSL